MCSMPFKIPARVDVILAPEASRAVILRRGPSNWVRLILWHTDTDEFENGQWLRGRIYAERCALSPDGSLFLYFAAQHHKSRNGYLGTWTALSKPPYFTALALWPLGDTWSGGGMFIDNQTVWVHHGASALSHPDHRPSRDLRVISAADQLTKQDVAVMLRAKAQDWQLVHQPANKDELYAYGYRTKDPQVWHRAHLVDKRYVLVKRAFGYIPGNYPAPYILEYALKDQAKNTETLIDGTNWADWDQQGRLVYARDGQVFAQTVEQVGTFARPLADFNDQTFENIPTPDWATRW